ncbi:MAG: ATP-grasp domain-containing protein, partial [Longimicrobiales bacterium]
MKNVAFVAPYLAETTLRFVAAVAGLPGVRTAVLSCDPPERVPEAIRKQIDAFHRLPSGLDPSEILSAVKGAHQAWGGIDRLLGALEELQVPLGHIRDTLGIPGMSAETADNFRDKSKMKRVLREAGLPCARYALAHSPEDAHAFAGSIGYPLIAKPPAGSGARSTFRLESDQDLVGCLRALPPAPDRPVLLEEFITGDEFSFDSISLDGRVVWHSINHYLPTPLEVLREPWIQWCVLQPREVDDPLYGEIKPVAGAALTALGMDT